MSRVEQLEHENVETWDSEHCLRQMVFQLAEMLDRLEDIVDPPLRLSAGVAAARAEMLDWHPNPCRVKIVGEEPG